MKRFRLSLLVSTLLLFGLAQGTSLFVAGQTLLVHGAEPLLLSGTAQEQQVFLQFLALFFGGTIALLMLLHVYKGMVLYRLLFLFVAFLGLLKLFLLIFPFFLSLAIASIFILGFLLLPTVWAHDIVVIVAAIGIGPVFGLQFQWQFAAILLLILSVYDIVAVYITRHMVSLAHELIRRQASFALFIPDRFRNYHAMISQVQPGSGFMILGGGDVILPMILSISLLRVNMGAALASIGGMLVGITLNHFLIVTRHHPIPALPLITIGALLGALAVMGV